VNKGQITFAAVMLLLIVQALLLASLMPTGFYDGH
jgi:hypothetical protein